MAQERHYDMKDSGVEWIGEIPEHWCVKPQKRVVLQRSGGAWGDDPMNDEHDCFCMRIADFDFAHGRFKNTLTENLTKRNYENSQIERLSLQHGDLLIEKSGGGEKTPVGRSVVFDKDYKALFANFMDRLRCDKEQVNPWFFGYWWRTLYFKNITVPYIKQTTGLQNLDISELLDKEQVLLPPLPEQAAIVAYLDEKCAAIDSIIAEAKATIEEYRAWKASVIFEAVTKGLNPNAEMKDSGVEWIGLIPNDWKLSAVKRHYNITLGKMLESVPQSNEATLENYMCASNIKWGGIDITCNRQMWFSTSEKEEYLLKDGDLLVMEGGSAGTSAIYHGEFAPCYMQNSVNRCRSKDGSLTQFLYYWMFLVYHSGHVESACNRATIMHLTKEKLGRLPFVQVPISEQETIVAHLDSKCAAIDGVIAEKEALIGELETYKKSLIFETVTGKRRVC